MSNSTLTLQSVVNLASTHVDLLPLAGVGGYSNEPALSLANDVVQELLAAPLDWKFNRRELAMFVTTRGRQDYQFGGAVAFTTNGGAGIGLASANAVAVSGGVVTIQTLEPHRFSVGDTTFLSGVTMTTGTASKYNSVFTDDGQTSSWSGGWVLTAVASTSFSFASTTGQNNSDAGGAPGITDFGWLESATMVDMNNNSSPQPVRQLEAVREVALTSAVGIPEKICVLKDNGDGTLKIRFQYAPDSVVRGAKLVYQAKAPIKTALTDTWAPFPDEYSFVYRQGFLARCYRYLNSPRADAEYQKLQQAIAKALQSGDRETSDVHIYPAESLMTSEWGW
jgi:hypothetical protein